MSFKFLHLEQYAGPFAMEPAAFNFVLDFANQIDLSAHIQSRMNDDDGLDVMPDMTMSEDGIACISCIGMMTKYGSSLSDGPSTIALRRCIRQNADDPHCIAIMLIFDTPGGTSDGTEELASEIAAAGARKPVWGFADGMACSAGYWAFSQCQRCIAGPASVIGSIGTYGVMYDRSGQFAKNGVKAIVVKAGELKGMGALGTKITDDQIAEQSRFVNQVNDLFVEAVARGRKIQMKRAEALNDGRVHVGANAKALGLVDQIGGFDDAMAGLRAVALKSNASIQPPGRPARSRALAMAGAIATMGKRARFLEAMRTEFPGPPASITDLKTAFPSSTAEWREKCLEDGLSMSGARWRWDDHADDMRQGQGSNLHTSILLTGPSLLARAREM